MDDVWDFRFKASQQPITDETDLTLTQVNEIHDPEMLARDFDDLVFILGLYVVTHLQIASALV